MKVLIAGAGAMGSRFGIYLYLAKKDVTLVDGWKAHVDAIKENGLIIPAEDNLYDYHIPVYLQGEKIDQEFDLIILFTKANQLDDMLKSLTPVITDSTKVLCLLNGIGHEEIIENYVPRHNIFIGNTLLAGSLAGPGKVNITGKGSVSLRNLVDGYENEAKEIVNLLAESNIDAIYTEDIMLTIYKKACINGTMNGLCTILDANMADVGETSSFHEMAKGIIGEFAAIANHEGVPISAEEMLSFIENVTIDRTNIGNHFPSMHQDLIASKRLTEIDYINGVIVRKGEKYGIPTPYCKFLTQLVHSKEELLGAK